AMAAALNERKRPFRIFSAKPSMPYAMRSPCLSPEIAGNGLPIKRRKRTSWQTDRLPPKPGQSYESRLATGGFFFRIKPVKLAWKDIESFVKSPDPRARAILVYGPDDGLMRERAKIMGASLVADLSDPFNVAVLDGELLVSDPARLADEASAMSMMGGARLIRIENASDKISPLLRDY